MRGVRFSVETPRVLQLLMDQDSLCIYSENGSLLSTAMSMIVLFLQQLSTFAKSFLIQEMFLT
jgi:hypothetical protein